MKTICLTFEAKLKKITKLSNKINKGNNKRILDMMKEHADCDIFFISLAEISGKNLAKKKKKGILF